MKQTENISYLIARKWSKKMTQTKIWLVVNHFGRNYISVQTGTLRNHIKESLSGLTEKEKNELL